MTLSEATLVLAERRNWLTARIKAKQSVGWDVEWDIRERDALTTTLCNGLPASTVAAIHAAAKTPPPLPPPSDVPRVVIEKGIGGGTRTVRASNCNETCVCPPGSTCSRCPGTPPGAGGSSRTHTPPT